MSQVDPRYAELVVAQLRQFVPDPRVRIWPANYGTSGPQVALLKADQSEDSMPTYFDVQLFVARYMLHGQDAGDDATFAELSQLGIINIDPRTLAGPKNPNPNDPARQPGFMPGPGTPEHRARMLTQDNPPTGPTFPPASTDPHGLE